MAIPSAASLALTSASSASLGADTDPRLRQMVKDVFVEEIAEPPSPPPAPVEPMAEAQRRVQAVLARVRNPSPVRPREVVLPVTQLQDFFLCPRRYMYAHEVGLSEHPMVFEREELCLEREGSVERG